MANHCTARINGIADSFVFQERLYIYNSVNVACSLLMCTLHFIFRSASTIPIPPGSKEHCKKCRTYIMLAMGLFANYCVPGICIRSLLPSSNLIGNYSSNIATAVSMVLDTSPPEWWSTCYIRWVQWACEEGKLLK